MAGRCLSLRHAPGPGGWEHVCSRVPMVDGKFVGNGVVEQIYQAIVSPPAIAEDAGYTPHDILRCGLRPGNARNVLFFNPVLVELIGECVHDRTTNVSSMVIGCTVDRTVPDTRRRPENWNGRWHSMSLYRWQ
jgi:hypothetical protein